MSDESRTITLTLTEPEVKTLVSALNAYGHRLMRDSIDLLTVDAAKAYGEEKAREGSELSQRCSKRAFALQGMVQEAWWGQQAKPEGSPCHPSVRRRGPRRTQLQLR